MADPEEKTTEDPKTQTEESETGIASTLSSTATSVESTSDMLLRMMSSMKVSGPKLDPVLAEFTLEGIAKFIKSEKCKNIVTMAGAGISTSAGIPDFRSPGSGLYDNLQKYDLPNPQAIFDIDYFKKNPEPFFKLAKELWPGTFKPTPCHYFINLLKEKGLLLRHFTQNIDTLDRLAGLDTENLVEAHGTFHRCHCVECKREYTQDWIKEEIFADRIPKCSEEDCGGFVKPDIVFFGEPLPMNFFITTQEDLPKCDLLIILGTSLQVHPFSSLIHKVPDTCPRLYINMDKPEENSEMDFMSALMGMTNSFRFSSEDNYRDVFWQGTCDDGCRALAKELGWFDELEEKVKSEHARIDAEDADKEKPKL